MYVDPLWFVEEDSEGAHAVGMELVRAALAARDAGRGVWSRSGESLNERAFGRGGVDDIVDVERVDEWKVGGGRVCTLDVEPELDLRLHSPKVEGVWISWLSSVACVLPSGLFSDL